MNREYFRELVYFIAILFFLIIIEAGFISASCSLPKNADVKMSLHGNVYDKVLKPYGGIAIKGNRFYMYGYRLLQFKDYEIVAISGKNITCIKKITSWSSLRAYCDNSFCGGFEYCGTVKLKNYKYYLYNAEDIDCKNKNILKNKPILK